LIAAHPEIERKGKTVPYTLANGHMFTAMKARGMHSWQDDPRFDSNLPNRVERSPRPPSASKRAASPGAWDAGSLPFRLGPR